MNRLPSSRRAAKRVIAVLAMGIFAMTAVVLLRDQGRAGADEVSLTLNRRCHFYGAQWGDFDIPLSTNDSPDTAEPGGQVSLSITTGLPTTELEAIVIGARGSFTIPTGLTLQDVTFADTPGTTANFTGSYTTSGNTFVLHYAADGGGVLLADSVLPTATATFAVSPSLAGTTINWEAPTSIDADVDIGLGFTVTTNCTPNTVEPFVNTTPVSGTATTTVTTAPADPWQAFIDFIVGVIRFIVCLFTGVC